MLNTLEAILDEQGQIHLSEPIRLSGRRRVLVTILNEPPVEAQASDAITQTTQVGPPLALLESLAPEAPTHTTQAGRLLALMEQRTPEIPAQTTKAGRLLALLDKLERLPPSSRTTEEMNADIQAERDAWER